MKFQILQENLGKAVSIASRFASQKAQLPVLGNILLSTQKTKIYVNSTNLEVSVSVQVGAKIEEEGEISVPSRVISDLISNLPKETISIESEKEQLKISTSNFSSKVLGMNSSDFPKIPVSSGKEKTINISLKEFLEAISYVLFATSVDETRPVLTGVLFLWDKEGLTLVATDGFRLSRKRINVESQKVQKKVESVIIPKLVLSELSRLGSEQEEVSFSLLTKEKQAVFATDEVILSSRILEGEYPDFEKILPKSSSLKVLLDKEEFGRAVKLASVFARDAANVVKLKILKDSIKVSGESGQSGSQETKVDAKIESSGSNLESGFEIAFNYRFLEEFLHSVRGEEVKMEFTTPDKAGVFTDSGDKDYLHLIMPVKVQG
jgi:DNA polymerase-3 subunit beta